MKTPFNFTKNVFGKKEIQKSVTKSEMSEVHAPQKPVEQVKEEKRVTEPPKHETKSYSKPSVLVSSFIPWTFEDRQNKIRAKRTIKNRMQKRSRIINRSN
jgi:hypothetical protein